MREDVNGNKVDEEASKILCGPKLPVEIPIITVGQYLFGRLRAHNPNDVLMREAETGRTITPLDFLTLSIRVAEAMKTIGLQRGDVVTIMARAGIDTYASATGVLFQGGTVSPMDHSMPSDVFRLILSTTKPKFVFCDADIADDVTEVLVQLKNSARVILFNADPEESTTNHYVFENFIQQDVDFGSFRPASSSDTDKSIAFLVCSSGTMGIPKPVMMSDRNLMYQVVVWSFLSTMNKLISCPAITFSYFFWISGVLLYMAAVSLNFDMTIVQKIDAKHILTTIDKHKPVWGMFSPALLKYLTIYPDFKSYDVSSVILMITGGSPLQKDVISLIKKSWGSLVNCRQSYGVTEICGGATATRLGDDTLSVGCLLPGFELKITNPSNGKLQGPRQKGEIYLRSPSVMKGYMNNEAATKGVIQNGWYRTGDYGYYTEDGLIYISGRIKDFVTVNDKMVAPAEIEEVILGIPGVFDVGVVGIKVDDGNHLLMALVIKGGGSNLTEEDIVKYVDNKMEDHQHLRGGVCFVKNIPKTATGKMKRNDLLELAKSLHMEE